MEPNNNLPHRKPIFHPAKGLGTLLDNSGPIPPWNLLKEEVCLPAAVLNTERLEHNLNWMQTYVEHYGYKLAPHGKTTMCPVLFQKQLAKGAWAITLASAVQTGVAHSFGVHRVLMANQLIGRRNMGLIADIQDRDPTFDFYCVVDSAANVRALGQFFQERNQKIQILLEYGSVDGRTGVRNEEQEKEILEAVKIHGDHVRLVGVEFFEGVFGALEPVEEMTLRVLHRFVHLAISQVFSGPQIILTGAGSQFFDVVSEKFAAVKRLSCLPYQVEVVLRSGCYLTHAARMYEPIENRLLLQNPVDGNPLRPALNVWAYVQSRPEPNLVIVGFGKRESLNDCGFPLPILHFRPGTHEEPRSVAGGKWEVTRMMDQHSFLTVEAEADLEVGDILVFDICHPCTTFDKFKYILAAGNDFVVQDVFECYFA